MFHNQPLVKGIAILFFACIVSACKAQSVSWNALCQATNGRQLTLTTDAGDTVEGYCLATSVSEVSIASRQNRIIRISRSALSHLEVERRKGHQLNALGKGVKHGFAAGGNMILSPYAPVGLVVLPATAAWAIIAAPFCGLGDLVSKASGRREVRIL